MVFILQEKYKCHNSFTPFNTKQNDIFVLTASQKMVKKYKQFFETNTWWL